MPHQLTQLLNQYKDQFADPVPFDRLKDQVLLLDFTATNLQLTAEILLDTAKFSQYVSSELAVHQAKYGWGGYMEHRTVYSRSKVFDPVDGSEPRRLHLGIDIWGEVGTPVYSFMDGTIESIADNNRFGDYGATIIVAHQLEEQSFYALYGHLSAADLTRFKKGDKIGKGDLLAHFGPPAENGHWPPHLHLQLMLDLQGWIGDYPGVCELSKREQYAANCPDPVYLLPWKK